MEEAVGLLLLVVDLTVEGFATLVYGWETITGIQVTEHLGRQVVYLVWYLEVLDVFKLYVCTVTEELYRLNLVLSFVQPQEYVFKSEITVKPAAICHNLQELNNNFN